jgi:RHS repeat-associated protein
VSLDMSTLRSFPRLRVSDQTTSGSLRLSRLSFAVFDLFLVFLIVALGILAAFSLLLSPITHIPLHLKASVHAAPSGPVFARPVVNTPARAFDPNASPSLSGKAVAAPSTTVAPVDGLGDVGFYDYFTDPINKSITLKVNVADGNLVVETSAVSIRGTGIDLSLGTTYNSLGNLASSSGTGWTSNFEDASLQGNSDGSVTYFDPTGHHWTYLSNGKGGWTNPAGLDADLAFVSSGTLPRPLTLTFYKTGEVYTFYPPSEATSNYVGGSLGKETDKNNNSITFNRTATEPVGSQITSITDTQGRTTTISYDSSGHVSQITDPLQRSISYGYDSDNELTSITDQNGKVTQFGYTNGTLTLITDPLGNTTTIAYNSNGQVGAISDPLHHETNFTYYGSSDSQCSGVQPPTSTPPPTLNPCTVVNDAKDHKTTYGYDTTFRILKVEDAHEKTTSRTYSPDNNVQQYADSLLDQTVFSFATDASGHNNLQSVTDGNGITTNFGYTDPNHPSYPTTVKNATDQQQTTATYDTNGNVVTTKDTTTGGTGVTTTTSAYNNNGTIASERDGKNNQTSFAYDSEGNLIQVSFAGSLLPAQTLTVDAISRVTSLTDGNHNTTTYTYDNLDQLLKVTYADSTSVAYTYDANGNITSVTDSTGVTTFTYDADNRQITKTLPGGTVITTTFDPVGNLTSLSTVGGITTYTYNAVNVLVSLTEPGGATTTFGYDADYRRTQTNYPNGVSLSTTYDKDGQILTIIGTHGSTVLTSFTYTYTANNLRAQVIDQTGQKTTYGYDTLSRLTSANVSTSSGTHENAFTYAYDAASNRTRATQGVTSPTTTTSSYNAVNELTSATQGTTTASFSYDNNGNATGGSATPSITYNDANQTTAIGSTTFGYSGPDQNQRVQVNSTNFVYSGLGCDCESNAAGSTYYTHDASGHLIDERTSTGTYYYLFDGLGSVVGLTNSMGALVGNETYHYDPYGVLLSQPVSAALQTNAWRYAGGYYDVSTSLYKFGIRYYNAATGRWTQRDPVGGSLLEMVKVNPYVYVGDDPVNEVDPSGAGDCLGSILTNGGSAFTLELAIDGVAAVVIWSLLGSVIGIPVALALFLVVGYVDVRISIYAYNLIANDCGWIPIII